MKRKLFFSGAGIIFAIGVVLFTLGWVFEYAIMPSIVKTTVKKNLVLGFKDDGRTLNTFANDWLYSNYSVYMQYWVYDYTNTIEMSDRGMKPDAVEKGPYSYRQVNKYPIDVHESFDPDGNTFEYIEESYYYFDPLTSCPTCNPWEDRVRIPDIVFFTAMGGIESLFGGLGSFLPPQMAPLLDDLVGVLFSSFKAGPFITVTVDQLLMSSYESPIVAALRGVIGAINPALGSALLPYIDALAAQAHVKLNTNNGTLNETFWYQIDTGKRDYNNVGQMMGMRPDSQPEFNQTLPEGWWNDFDNETCFDADIASSIRGTNGDYFKPFLKKSDVLTAYVEDICRSIDFVFDSESNVKGVDTWRFVIPPSAFDYSLPENCGFCRRLLRDMYGAKKDSHCLPNGLLDLSGCKGNQGIVASLPHFYNADQKVLRQFPRMRPLKERDETSLDIQPTTGTVLAAHKRLQINIVAGQFGGVYKLIPNGVYPLIWVNNSYTADDKTIQDMKDDLITPQHTVKLVSFILGVGFGALLMVIGALSCILRQIYDRHQEEEHGKQVRTNHQISRVMNTSFAPSSDEGSSNLTHRIPRAAIKTNT